MEHNGESINKETQMYTSELGIHGSGEKEEDPSKSCTIPRTGHRLNIKLKTITLIGEKL